MWQHKLYILLMLMPATVVLVGLFLGSLIVAFLQSLGYAPIYGVNEFPTLHYYGELFTLPSFWRSVFYTFYYALVPTIVGAILSIYLALILRKSFFGKKLFSYLYKLPLMIPYLVGVSLTMILFANGGLIARFLYSIGLIESTQQFPQVLNSQGGWGIMLVYLWKQIPFSTLIIHSVLVGLGTESEEAAVTLGANPRQTFWHVTLPQLMPGIVSSTVIVFAFNFSSFEVPFILGEGFPSTLTVEAWRAFDNADYTRRLQAMAIVIFISLVSSLILIIYLSFYRRFERLTGRQ